MRTAVEAAYKGLGSLDFDDFAACVMSAIGADVMWKVFVATIRADDQVTRANGVMGSTAVAPAFRDFSFREWRHDRSLRIAQDDLPLRAGSNIIAGLGVLSSKAGPVIHTGDCSNPSTDPSASNRHPRTHEPKISRLTPD